MLQYYMFTIRITQSTIIYSELLVNKFVIEPATIILNKGFVALCTSNQTTLHMHLPLNY